MTATTYKVLLYDVAEEDMDELFWARDPALYVRILYENGLCEVTCATYECAIDLYIEMRGRGYVVEAEDIDADSIEEEECEDDGWCEEDYNDRCICGDYLDANGRCRECRLGLGGINQYRF